VIDTQVVAQLIADKRLFTENLLQIYDKQRNLVPFIYNKTQAHYHANMSNRDIICKASQLGFTSKIMADFLIDCITIPGTTSIVVAHEEFITGRLLNKARFFYDILPVELKPPIHHKSTHELTWPDLNSTFYIGSSMKYVFARGERIDNFLASEMAFWQNPGKILTPANDRVPLDGRLIIESTPFGEGTLYYDVFKAAEAGTSTFKCQFYPWWWGEDYQLAADSPYALERDQRSPLMELQDDELHLMEKFGITEAQIRWRRMKLASPGAEDFFQEFPEDSESCFYTSTLLYFPKTIVTEWLEGSTPRIFQWPLQDPFLDVWFKPNPSGRYIVSCDPTEGVESPGAITVWNIAAGEKIRHEATALGWWEPPLIADMLKKVGRYYKSKGRHPAMLAVERNSCGIAVLNALVDYPNVYCMPDLITGKPKKKPGWRTDRGSKPHLLSNFRGEMMGEALFTQDRRLATELRRFRRVGPDVESFGAVDLAMAAMIGIAAMTEYQTVKRGYVGAAPGWSW